MPTFEQIQFEIANMLDVPDEELDEEQRKEMNEYLDMLASQEANKVDGFAAFIKEETARVTFLKDESRRLADKAKIAERRMAFLKSRYLQIMQEHGLQRIKGNIYTLSIRRSQSVEVDNVETLDDFYCRIVPARREADKKIIGEYLKGGGNLDGCRLVESNSLQIR
ncbi:MAG: siphovirus Gp157 family protein [Desulfovibrio sp.]|nr:siphovirus Gp157 family protein [Desulfovibrio sp.]